MLDAGVVPWHKPWVVNEFGEACRLAEQAYKLIFNVEDENSNSNNEE